MGPRHRCRGISSRSTRRPASCALQWGRGIAAAESPARIATGGCLNRFNGAAASLPRNRLRPEDAAGMDRASMGPRHRCRGMAGSAGSAPGPLQGFNGAAASLPRNLAQVTLAAGRQAASMGPRHRCRGMIGHIMRLTAETLLQWGRGIAAAE